MEPLCHGKNPLFFCVLGGRGDFTSSNVQTEINQWAFVINVYVMHIYTNICTCILLFGCQS